MDLGSLVFSLCVMIISPPGGVRCSAGDAVNCECPAIPLRSLTQPPPETCFPINSSFRYKCKNGYVREAGTSNLIRCKNTDGVVHWTGATLRCIPDPRIPPPSPTVTQGRTDTPPVSTIATTVTGKVNVTETQTTAGMTPAATTAVPSQNSTAGSQVHVLTSTTNIVIVALIVIVCACAGISFCYYKRRTRHMIPVRTSEPDVPMDDMQSGNGVCSEPATAAESSRLNGDPVWEA